MAARWLFIVFLLLAASGARAAGPARAQPADTTVAPLPSDTLRPDALPLDTVALPAVTVEATRLPLGLAGRRATVLTPEDIAASASLSAADLLEARTGVFVKRYGAGGLATVSLRGAGSAQTLVLVDGQRVADPQTGQVDLSLLPAVVLESAEVVHGAQSARYGSGALGGVVRLRTIRPTRALRVRTTAEAGAFGARRLGAAVSGGTHRLAALAAVEQSTADGDFPYPSTLDEPQTLRREGAARALTTLFGKVRYQATEGSALRLTAWYSRAERGLPGTANAPPGGARQWDEALRLRARQTITPGWGRLTLAARAQHATLRYLNPSDHPDFYVDQTTRTQSYAAEATAHVPFGVRWALSGGAELGLDRAALRGGAWRRQAALHVSGVGDYGRLQLAPALRLDAFRAGVPAASGASPGSSGAPRGRGALVPSPQLSATWQPLADDRFHLKAGLARAFRAPTLGERFSEPSGNPGLRAERGWSAEGGLVFEDQGATRALRAEATAFYTRMRDQIVWNPSYVGPGVQVWRPSNAARVVTRGLELSLGARAQPAEAVDLNADLFFTHTDARGRSNPMARAYNQPLRYVPRQQLKLNLSARWGLLTADLSSRLVSERFITTDASQSVPPYHVLDAQLRLRKTLGPMTATLGLALENALDARYSIIRYYPMPPRHARLRLTLETTP